MALRLTEKKGGEFTPHPETDGPVKAVIVDRTPLKIVQSQFGEREVFRFVFETEVMDEENQRRFCIWSRPYTPSLNPKANLRKDLKKILGRELTDPETEGFDVDSLIGHPVKLIVQHETSEKGDTFAIISFIAPDKANPLKPSGKYIRVEDRPPKDGAAAGGQSSYRSTPKADADEARQDWQKCKVHVGKHAGVDLGDLDEEAVKNLIEKWLPKHESDHKPKADDKRLAAALATVAELLGISIATPEEEEEF